MRNVSRERGTPSGNEEEAGKTNQRSKEPREKEEDYFASTWQLLNFRA